PVLGAHDGVELIRVVAERVQTAHDAAHTRAGDHVHRNARLLQHFQHADVREAPRRAPTQGNADFWGVGGLCTPRGGDEQQTEREHETRRSHGALNRSTTRLAVAAECGPDLSAAGQKLLRARASRAYGPVSKRDEYAEHMVCNPREAISLRE